MITERGYAEEPFLFGRHRSLVGTVCRPVSSAKNPSEFIVFINAGIIHQAGPNRLYVRLARALAKSGFPSLRFDLSGIGDSLIPTEAPAMSVLERVEIDIDDALALLRERHGADRFVLIGLCSGADYALRTMGRVTDVAGAVLLDLNAHRTLGFYPRHYARLLRYYARKAVQLRSWLEVASKLSRQASTRRPEGRLPEAGLEGPDAPSLDLDSWLGKSAMRDHLQRVIGRDARLLCVFTAGLAGQYNYGNQFLDLFPDLDFGDCLTLRYYDDSDHTFSSPAMRDRLTSEVIGWLREVEPSWRED